jgi:hypothetical protein
MLPQWSYVTVCRSHFTPKCKGCKKLRMLHKGRWASHPVLFLLHTISWHSSETIMKYLLYTCPHTVSCFRCIIMHAGPCRMVSLTSPHWRRELAGRAAVGGRWPLGPALILSHGLLNWKTNVEIAHFPQTGPSTYAPTTVDLEAITCW